MALNRGRAQMFARILPPASHFIVDGCYYLRGFKRLLFFLFGVSYGYWCLCPEKRQVSYIYFVFCVVCFIGVCRVQKNNNSQFAVEVLLQPGCIFSKSDEGVQQERGNCWSKPQEHNETHDPGIMHNKCLFDLVFFCQESVYCFMDVSLISISLQDTRCFVVLMNFI